MQTTGAERQDNREYKLQAFGLSADLYVCSLTLGNPASSQSLIMPIKSVARVATNSARNAHMTEFSRRALWENKSILQLQTP